MRFEPNYLKVIERLRRNPIATWQQYFIIRYVIIEKVRMLFKIEANTHYDNNILIHSTFWVRSYLYKYLSPIVVVWSECSYITPQNCDLRINVYTYIHSRCRILLQQLLHRNLNICKTDYSTISFATFHAQFPSFLLTEFEYKILWYSYKIVISYIAIFLGVNIIKPPKFGQP